jgi:tripartite-type tricarboxylate transporter receptor subunit TctC
MTSTSKTRRRLVLAALAAPLATAGHRARAEDYPSRPIRVIVPWPAGGVADVATRRVTARMEALLGQSIIVENRGGASGMIGADYVAKAAPDGYTLLRGDLVTHAVDPYLFKVVPYDPIKDFAPISGHGKGPLILVVHPSLPVKSVAELIAYAKAHPGTLNYGAPIGAPQHLAAEMLVQSTGVSLVHVPYKGEGPAVTDLVAGQIHMMFSFPTVAGSFVKTGRLRGLAVTYDRRIALLPDVPTMREVGLPELELTAWGAFFAPAGTPRPIIDKLNAAVVTAMQDAEIQALLRGVGAEAFTTSPEQLADMLKTEMERWARVVKRSGVRLD